MSETPRAALVAAAQALSRDGLSPGRSGNLSARRGSGLWITPTGIAAEDLTAADISEIDLEGAPRRAGRAPSSEWPMHAAIYAGWAEAQAIVHLHSRYATALSCLRQDIPAFHYMVAKLGGPSIRCAAYATFGTRAIAENALSAMRDGRRACLLANHGQITYGRSLDEAVELAQELETLACQYMTALSGGTPALLDAEEMAVNLEKFKTYGQPSGDKQS